MKLQINGVHSTIKAKCIKEKFMIKVITHDGKFHPDEIFACVLLNYFTGDELKIIRTRDEKIIAQAQKDYRTYVVDVGGVYDPKMNNLDHHQSTFNKTGTNGDVLSSCGLMWHKLRNTLNLSDFIKNKIDEFTINIDRHDNGVEYFKEVEIISLYNYYEQGKVRQNTKFRRAYAMACTHFKNLMNMWHEIEQRELSAIEAIKHAKDGIIFSEERLGVNETMNATDNFVVVTPRSGDEYTINSLNEGIEIDFSTRCPAPVEWRGLSDKDLNKASGFKDMVFCHKSGFITIVKGKENALAVAKEIIKQHKQG